MDKRGREANRRHRSTDINYKTISLTLDKKLVEFLYKEIEKTEDKNMSKFIEEIVIGSKIKEMPKRREFKTCPIKKTFSFSEKFVEEIKKSGNMSLCIEAVLKEKYNIK